MMKREPDPGVLSTSTVPPCAVTMAWTRARPSPAPPASRLLAASRRTNGSKMRVVSAGSMPMPVSCTTMWAWPLRAIRDRPTLPPDGVYFTALSTRFWTARRRLPASPRTATGSISSTRTCTPVPWARRVPASRASNTRGSRSTRSRRMLMGAEEREKSRRSSARRVRCFTSSRPERRTRRYSSDVRSARRATSISPWSAVRRVRREAPRLGEGGLEAREHGVERIREVIDLVLGAAPAEAAPQVLRGDLACRARHVAHRIEGAAGDHEATRRGQGHRYRYQGEERGEIAGERVVELREGRRDLDDLHAPPFPQHGHGEESYGTATGIVERLEGTAPVSGVEPRHGGEGQRHHRRPGAEARAAFGIQELIVAIGEAGTEQLANGAIHLGAARAALVRLAHDLGHGGERGVDLLEQAPPQEGIGEHAHHGEDGQEHPRVPEGEPGPDGQRSHASSFST